MKPRSKPLKIVITLSISLLLFILVGMLRPVSAQPAVVGPITLDMNLLPSAQGWTYADVGGNVPEADIFSASGGLHQNSIGQSWTTDPVYSLPNVVDANRPFILSVRARVLANDNPSNPHSFDLVVNTGTEAFEIGIGPTAIRNTTGSLYVTTIDNTQWHNYRMEGIPGVSLRFFVDDVLIGTDVPYPFVYPNQLMFGDATQGSNASVDIGSYSFSQESVAFTFEGAGVGGNVEYGSQDPQTFTTFVQDGFVVDVAPSNAINGLLHWHEVDSVLNSKVPDRPTGVRGVLSRDGYSNQDPLFFAPVDPNTTFTLASLVVGTTSFDGADPVAATGVRLTGFFHGNVVATIVLAPPVDGYASYSATDLGTLQGITLDRLEIIGLGNNTYTYYQLDNVVLDVSTNTPPTIAVNDITLKSNTIGGRTLVFSDIGSASDAEDGIPSVSCAPAIGSVLPLGSTIITCTATDSGGLTATASGTAKVVTTISMGPQAMEGDLRLSAGDTLQVGYDFTMPGSHPATSVGFVETEITFPYTCIGGVSSGSFRVPIANQSYSDPTNSSAWYPSGNQHSPAVFQASFVIPSTLCGSGLVRLNQGGTFNSGVTASPSGYKLNVRWHYSANGSAGGWSGTKSIVPN